MGNQSLARELCLTARKFDSKEANQCGFVNQVFEVNIQSLTIYLVFELS